MAVTLDSRNNSRLNDELLDQLRSLEDKRILDGTKEFWRSSEVDDSGSFLTQCFMTCKLTNSEEHKFVTWIERSGKVEFRLVEARQSDTTTAILTGPSLKPTTKIIVSSDTNPYIKKIKEIQVTHYTETSSTLEGIPLLKKCLEENVFEAGSFLILPSIKSTVEYSDVDMDKLIQKFIHKSCTKLEEALRKLEDSSDKSSSDDDSESSSDEEKEGKKSKKERRKEKKEKRRREKKIRKAEEKELKKLRDLKREAEAQESVDKLRDLGFLGFEPKKKVSPSDGVWSFTSDERTGKILTMSVGSRKEIESLPLFTSTYDKPGHDVILDAAFYKMIELYLPSWMLDKLQPHTPLTMDSGESFPTGALHYLWTNRFPSFESVPVEHIEGLMKELKAEVNAMSQNSALSLIQECNEKAQQRVNFFHSNILIRSGVITLPAKGSEVIAKPKVLNKGETEDKVERMKRMLADRAASRNTAGGKAVRKEKMALKKMEAKKAVDLDHEKRSKQGRRSKDEIKDYFENDADAAHETLEKVMEHTLITDHEKYKDHFKLHDEETTFLEEQEYKAEEGIEVRKLNITKEEQLAMTEATRLGLKRKLAIARANRSNKLPEKDAVVFKAVDDLFDRVNRICIPIYRKNFELITQKRLNLIWTFYDQNREFIDFWWKYVIAFPNLPISVHMIHYQQWNAFNHAMIIFCFAEDVEVICRRGVVMPQIAPPTWLHPNFNEMITTSASSPSYIGIPSDAGGGSNVQDEMSKNLLTMLAGMAHGSLIPENFKGTGKNRKKKMVNHMLACMQTHPDLLETAVLNLVEDAERRDDDDSDNFADDVGSLIEDMEAAVREFKPQDRRTPGDSNKGQLSNIFRINQLFLPLYNAHPTEALPYKVFKKLVHYAVNRKFSFNHVTVQSELNAYTDPWLAKINLKTNLEGSGELHKFQSMDMCSAKRFMQSLGIFGPCKTVTTLVDLLDPSLGLNRTQISDMFFLALAMVHKICQVLDTVGMGKEQYSNDERTSKAQSRMSQFILYKYLMGMRNMLDYMGCVEGTPRIAISNDTSNEAEGAPYDFLQPEQCKTQLLKLAVYCSRDEVQKVIVDLATFPVIPPGRTSYTNEYAANDRDYQRFKNGTYEAAHAG